MELNRIIVPEIYQLFVSTCAKQIFESCVLDFSHRVRLEKKKKIENRPIEETMKIFFFENGANSIRTCVA